MEGHYGSGAATLCAERILSAYVFTVSVLLLLFSVLILVGVSLFGLMDIKLVPVQMLMLHMIVNVVIILMIQATNLFKLNPVRAR